MCAVLSQNGPSRPTNVWEPGETKKSAWRCVVATANSAEGLQSPLAEAKKITGWYLTAAVLFIILGIFAVIEPGIAGLGVTLRVGWILAIGAVFHFVAAFKGGGAKQVIFQVLIGILYGIGGFYFLTHTIMATGTLTLLLAGIILAEGVIEVISYFRLRKEGASAWLLFNGLITLALGALIWLHWPSSTVWAIGTLVGINLLMTGITRLMFGLAIRKMVGSGAGS
jgi:uncharacterized membrane protein HdeD (DUF308 family)